MQEGVVEQHRLAILPEIALALFDGIARLGAVLGLRIDPDPAFAVRIVVLGRSSRQ